MFLLIKTRQFFLKVSTRPLSQGLKSSSEFSQNKILQNGSHIISVKY